jgi:hypothetical protein
MSMLKPLCSTTELPERKDLELIFLECSKPSSTHSGGLSGEEEVRTGPISPQRRNTLVGHVLHNVSREAQFFFIFMTLASYRVVFDTLTGPKHIYSYLENM